MDKDKKEFMDWVCQQDAEQEERQETPTHRHRPNVDWDRFEQQIKKGK